jgi:hypothetical protein
MQNDHHEPHEKHEIQRKKVLRETTEYDLLYNKIEALCRFLFHGFVSYGPGFLAITFIGSVLGETGSADT